MRCTLWLSAGPRLTLIIVAGGVTWRSGNESQLTAIHRRSQNLLRGWYNYVFLHINDSDLGSPDYGQLHRLDGFLDMIMCDSLIHSHIIYTLLTISMSKQSSVSPYCGKSQLFSCVPRTILCCEYLRNNPVLWGSLDQSGLWRLTLPAALAASGWWASGYPGEFPFRSVEI